MTQTDRFSVALKGISVELTPNDRKTIMDTCSISQPTLTRYLSGQVDNLDTAAAIVAAAKDCFAKREQVLNELQAD